MDDRTERGAATDGGVSAIVTLAADGAWKEALASARTAIRAGVPKEDTLVALARGALLDGRADRAERALEQLPAEVSDRHDVVLLRVRVLRGLGRPDEARVLAERALIDRPDDDEVSAVVQALRPAPRGVRGRLPLDTLWHAERVAAAGYPGRALRVVRRLMLDHPDDTDVFTAAIRFAVAVEAQGEHLQDLLVGQPLPELDDVPEIDADLGPIL